MKNALSLLLLLVSAVAAAEEPAFEVSLKAGGRFPQVASRLGTTFDGLLKLGYAVNEARTIQIYGDLGYASPSYTFTREDPRLAAGTYTSTLTVLDVKTSVGVTYFFAPPSEVWLPYAGLGPHVHFVKSTATGEAGTAFGANEETVTGIGAVAFGGVGFHLGPGLLLGELRAEFVRVEQQLTGPSNLGGLSLLLGYGLLF